MISPKSFYAGDIGSSGTVYTVPSGKVAIIQGATIVNGSSSAPTVSIQFGAIDVLRNKALTADQSYVADELRRHVLEAGTTVVASTSAPGTVRLILSGVEVDV